MCRKWRVLGSVATAALMISGVLHAKAQQPAEVKSPELSDKSVKTLMEYAWIILPSKFTTPNGKTIEVDKKKRDAMVPLEAARDVIKAGNISAQAQVCDMMDAQIANYNALMTRERVKNTWSDQQLLYITTLHRMTIHVAAGKLRVVEKGKDELQVFLEPIEKVTCDDDKKKRVVETVEAYVKSAPVLPAKAEAGAQPAAPTKPASAQPVPAAAAKDQKK